MWAFQGEPSFTLPVPLAQLLFSSSSFVFFVQRGWLAPVHSFLSEFHLIHLHSLIVFPALEEQKAI